MPNIGFPELLVIMVIVVLVFGVGRLGEVGGELGKGIREFKRAMANDDDDRKPKPQAMDSTDQAPKDD